MFLQKKNEVAASNLSFPPHDVIVAEDPILMLWGERLGEAGGVVIPEIQIHENLGVVCLVFF